MGLYVHVPFCKTKCPYCDFNTYQGIENLMEPFLPALTTEVECWGETLDHPAVKSVFFGGGTPSYLPPGYIEKILASIQESFKVDPAAEITIEANPGDLDEAACAGILAQGVNRLSIGVQSLDNGLLNLLGRRHQASEAVQAFEAARQAGFDNVNLDLMYGLPNQSMDQWRQTLDALAELAPEHISLYALTLEEGTPMHRWAEEGKIPEPDPDLAADMYLYARESLASAGYHHYEISNWSLPGRACEHNVVYWENGPYLGVGPGAHSRLGDYRFWTILSPRDYNNKAAAWADAGVMPVNELVEDALQAVPTLEGWEHLSQEITCSETMFLGLRLLDGLRLSKASARAGVDLAKKFQAPIQECIQLGLLEQDGDCLKLTKPAYLIANQAFTRFLE
ncbi:MAG: coproporphyrinogen III oxidase [Chloroflexi bacterium]|jgi:oxygen-independent coproporphyrinogen-3 oxidase|nr:MAG: coproporphyrinogen III oxidase [Chloroflexota bacterium]